MNNWEGGIRVNAWVSGGYLPPSVRGTKFEGLVTGWDWYSTFAEFAGIDPTDHRAAAAGLPAIDSHSMVSVLLGINMTSPRTEIPLGTQLCGTIGKLFSKGACWFPPGGKRHNYTVNGVISGQWKALVGKVGCIFFGHFTRFCL
jgi:hypothetical protein